MADLFTIPGAPQELTDIITARRARIPAGMTMQLDSEESPDETEGEAPAKFVDKDGSEYGFPAETPIAEMTDAQRAEYWRHKARKHEERNRKAPREDAEKKAPKPDEDVEARIRAEVRAETAERLVRAEFKVALAGRADAGEIDVLLAPLDMSRFLGSDGEVDGAKVAEYAGNIRPTTKNDPGPDMGQGRRGGTPAKGVSAGRDLHADRHKKNER